MMLMMMSSDRDLQMMKKQERAHFFSAKEQDLILKLYEEEREILTAKSNTTSASKLREEAWQRIADKINAASDSGYKRTWQQVKVKHKNIIQTAKRKRAEVLRTEGGSGSPSLTSAEEDAACSKESALRMEVLPGGSCVGNSAASDSSFMSVSGHPVLLLPVTKTEPESLSGDETDVSEAHVDEDVQNSSFQEGGVSAEPTRGPRCSKQTDEIRALYCRYLKKEMENRDQEMAYRALKMKKLEKEILLLDKQLM
ncbi:GT1 domain-containing protein isoform X2 [Cyprinodon tularosa]|uniref:GT1 domain-containing protein isoform X2 n=1 Tax=Cyprinodon tularosa TaxID=77115 RepID=UPI0018E21E6A|nr:GT1 domain-containing protein isoform X2 [Cyprinodon tularosa]